MSRTVYRFGAASILLVTSTALADESQPQAVAAQNAPETATSGFERDPHSTDYPAVVPETDEPSAAAPSGPVSNSAPRLGGHIGAATPLVTVSSDTTTIADAFTLLHPIGVSLKYDRITVDFETVVVNPISPGGNVGLVIDPGVIYNFGAFAGGLRLAWQQARSNFGLIPLINKGLVQVEDATWFVEAAFPTFYSDGAVQFNMVLHSGVGF